MNGSCELLADVSTVGNRVRIRHRSDSNAASTNMSHNVKLLDNNPPSALKEDDVCNLKTTYGLLSSVTLRLPLSLERAADMRPDEIVVYESYYDAGFREVIPSLIAQIATRLAISPGQLYPFAWRLLIAIQTFGELESIAIGVEEVMYAYYFTKFEADPGRYSMHTRNHPPLAIDLKHHAKKSLEEAWRERYIFKKVGRNLGFPTSWFVAGRAGALEVVKHLLPHRSVEFLTSSFALENSTIWGFTMSNGQQCSTSVAFARFMAASCKLTEANPASSNHVLDDYGDEVKFLGDTSSHKRKTHGDTITSSEARRSQKICNDRTVVVATTTSSDAEELKSKILSRNFETLIASGSES